MYMSKKTIGIKTEGLTKNYLHVYQALTPADVLGRALQMYIWD
jgi:hypothetical protein